MGTNEISESASVDAVVIGPELLSRIRDRYGPKSKPTCRLCGHAMTLGSIGGGRAEWVCDGPEANWLGMAPGPEKRRKEDHYSASRQIQTQFEDRDVMALVAYVESQ